MDRKFNQKSKAKSAFTLAEVLITLGVIGIVAAMTLPSLIGKYQAKVLRTEFLRANTILQDGITRMRADEVELSDVINKRDLETIKKYFASGNCELPNISIHELYTSYHNKPASHSAVRLELPYCLKSGMTMWFAKLYSSIDTDSGLTWIENGNAFLAIDINSWTKRPNSYGKDVFVWFYHAKSKTIKPLGGRYMDLEIPNSFYFTGCPGPITFSEAGMGCTVEALSDPFYFNKLKLSH